MSLFSLLKNYSADDWQNFFITGAAVITGVIILYFAFLRKQNKKDIERETTVDN